MCDKPGRAAPQFPRRGVLGLTAGLLGLALVPRAALAAVDRVTPEEVLGLWYRLVLELVRHTATYSPPVASRAFAYLGVAGFEALASGADDLRSLAGQVNGLGAVPPRDGQALDDAAILHAVLARSVDNFFGNTGPVGQRSVRAMAAKLGARIADGLPSEVAARSRAHGQAVAAHIFDWSQGDGGAVIENLGFPHAYTAAEGPARWVPTSRAALQQAPLLPGWGNNRPFAMPDGASCALAPPPPYSEDQGSAFYAEAMEVYEVSKALTDEQKAIARFWSDDPMLSPTPPGHWISIAMAIMARDRIDAARCAEVFALLGIALADAFIACWQAKFEFDLLRPVTYIRRVLDPQWQALLATPPFPEYPSGHSTQSGAAAELLTHLFGAGFAFEDATHVEDGLAARAFPDFRAAAKEAAVSRLYGGIHFRSAIDQGLKQGACIAAHAIALKTRA